MFTMIDETAAETAIISLSILKSISTIHGSKYASARMPLETGWDTVHELYYSAIAFCADKLNCKYLCDYETEVTGITNDKITAYYKAAYQFGELKALPDVVNPYIVKANQNLRETLGMIRHYTFDFYLYESKRRKPRLMLITSSEYYLNAEVIYQLYQFLGFYYTALPELEIELKSLQNRKKKRKPNVRRKAA